jgi:hypothetical protein
MPLMPPTNLDGASDFECIHLWWDGDIHASGYEVYYWESSPILAKQCVDVGDTTATTLEELENGVLYDIYVIAYDQFGNRTDHSNMISVRPNCWGAVEGKPTLPEGFALGKNYPNPFDFQTLIPYRLGGSSSFARLIVYNATGRQVRVLHEGCLPAGLHEAIWDGMDGKGLPVPPGVYFYRLEAGGFAQTSKMLLIK